MFVGKEEYRGNALLLLLFKLALGTIKLNGEIKEGVSHVVSFSDRIGSCML